MFYGKEMHVAQIKTIMARCRSLKSQKPNIKVPILDFFFVPHFTNSFVVAPIIQGCLRIDRNLFSDI
ncbi:hypothetical protein EUGRSUZ_I01439 [Eucalyptus grandis]|uniref:Uncharacterized protein n=2 Tax=Eucalyptus grandis TaxID=71139 RepID=A0ACC3JFP5_EUCGR|nr:hypothetical protein EUGRSUZ_I01439 [Eucalyptus grandis]